MNFFDPECHEPPRKDVIFGLCDDQNGTKAYSNTDDSSRWFATVKNDSRVELIFTAIDHCVIMGDEERGRRRCDGMLTSTEHIYFVELKNQRGGWIADAIAQLESTIQFFMEHHDISRFRYKKAFACNKRHRPFQKSKATISEHIKHINGETHLYLGKQYRLKLAQGDENSVKLSRGFFHVTLRDEPNPERAKKLLTKWYSDKASRQFNDSLERCWPRFTRFEFPKPAISIKRMQKRWGSLSDNGTVTLNTNLVKAPKECIDYVVIHELCHLKYRDHSPEFYKLLNAVIPAWEKVKHKLELGMV
jgi:predicted metal-dependent hydrolase